MSDPIRFPTRWPEAEYEAQFDCEEIEMPDIMPSKDDPIAVLIGTFGLIAKIGGKTPDGSYEIVLAGEPAFRASIKITDYEWNHDQSQWTRRMVPVGDGAILKAAASLRAPNVALPA